MKLPTAYAVQSELTSPKFAMNFAKGCGGQAVPATDDMDLLPGPAAFFGSPQIWNLITRARTDGRPYYYADHGHFKRGRNYRITKNRLQHDGIPLPPHQLTRDRLRANGVEVYPTWRKDGTHIVICPNSPVYMNLFGIDARAWTADLVTQLSKLTDRPLIVRWKAQAAKRPLYVDLVDAYCVIVFSSNAAVEGLVAGIPCITLADFAASRRMGRTRLEDIEDLAYPDGREDFLATLSMNQWSMAEIAKGDAWQVLRDQ